MSSIASISLESRINPPSMKPVRRFSRYRSDSLPALLEGRCRHMQTAVGFRDVYWVLVILCVLAQYMRVFMHSNR
jgi:hypothetical protein